MHVTPPINRTFDTARSLPLTLARMAAQDRIFVQI
jgi:hypothetical protein